MALLLLPSSVSTNPTSVRCLVTVRQLHALPLPMYNVYGRGYNTHFITRALSIPCFVHNDRKREHAYLPPWAIFSICCLISNTLPQLEQSSLQPSTVLHHRHLLQTTSYNHLHHDLSRKEKNKQQQARTPLPSPAGG